ncbi:MAG: hypothetical protein KBT30_00020, partial [Clostridiales bacterium]|nr:hypothetical protein [Candidatus Apopatousia equi]
CLVIVLLPSLFIAIIIRFLPKSFFDANKRFFKKSEKNKEFYIRIGIKNWKDKIPDFGQTVNFKKDKFIKPNSLEYVEKFISETCYAEVLHISCCVSALISMWLTLLILPSYCFFTMALPIAVVYVLFNMPSIMIQRYNRPRLMEHYTKLKGRSEQYDNNYSL